MTASRAILLTGQHIDPFFSYVTQLAHFDGTNGQGGPYTNSCPRGNTFNDIGVGGSGLDTSIKQFGTASWQTSGGNINHTASSADYNFGTGDWTVEFWLYPASLTIAFDGALCYFDMRTAATDLTWVPILLGRTNNGDLRLNERGSGSSVDYIIGATGSLVATTWQHIACCRAGGITRLFVGGTQIGSNYTDTNTYVQGPLTIGAAVNQGARATGHYDDVRITTGVGRYVANFTPPTAAFPNQ